MNRNTHDRDHAGTHLGLMLSNELVTSPHRYTTTDAAAAVIKPLVRQTQRHTG